MAEINQNPLSNVSNSHESKVEKPIQPEIGLSEPKIPQAKSHDVVSKMLAELEEYERQKERDAHFGKPKRINYPPATDEILQPFEHEPDEIAAKEHDGKPPPLPPVVGVRLKKSTAEIVRVGGEYHGGGSRGEITEISQSAIKNAVEVLTNAEPELNSMVVCTYPETFPTNGKVVKCHLKAIRQAIIRRYGRSPYFAAIEYQKRGAPHFHIGLGVDLGSLGEVVTIKRKRKDRRSPTFQTVKEHQDWLFSTWKRVVAKPNPAYEGERLDWSGITSDDAKMMDKAYFEHNSGVSWEVMRDSNGATKYFVKELSGLKGYQKRVPDGFTNPGRHFLYSVVAKPQEPKDGASVEDWEHYEASLERYKIDRAKYDMRFDDANALTFAVSEAELRQLLIESGWEFMPADDKPLFKRCWNAAAQLAIALIKRGVEPVSNSVESLRQYADLRMAHWADKASETWRYWAQYSETERLIAGMNRWESLKKKFAHQEHWDFIFSQEPMGP